VTFKEGHLSAHITPQKHPPDRQYFQPTSKEEIVERMKSMIERKFIFPLQTNQLSEKVVYITQRFVDWFNALMKALYQKKISSKEVIHILNFKRLLKKLPRLIEEFRESPYSFFGFCKTEEILRDRSKIGGINDSGLIIIPLENQLYGLEYSLITSFNFVPTSDKQEISKPLDEIYRSIGIPQYMEEIKKRKFLEKLFQETLRPSDWLPAPLYWIGF